MLEFIDRLYIIATLVSLAMAALIYIAMFVAKGVNRARKSSKLQ
jgi:hypothetical protein